MHFATNVVAFFTGESSPTMDQVPETISLGFSKRRIGVTLCCSKNLLNFFLMTPSIMAMSELPFSLTNDTSYC